MRALCGHLYNGLQVASAMYVLATLTLAVSSAHERVSLLPDTPPVEEAKPAAPPIQEVVAPAEPKPEAPKEPERPKPAIGFNIPEGQFDFAPAAGRDPKLGKADPGAFPFPPPEPAPEAAPSSPPLIYRRGRLSGPMRVVRNPWSNGAGNNRGDAARARAFAFDDRAEPAPRALGDLDPVDLRKRWQHDVEQYRTLSNRGHSEEDLRQRLGDKFSSVRWAASLDVSIDELPVPTDSYAEALNRELKKERRETRGAKAR